MFLRDPWYWPEIWQINPQVENPHLIFPGDMLSLAYLDDGRPAVNVERGPQVVGAAAASSGCRRAFARSRSRNAIADDSVRDDAAFLSRPRVVEKDELDDCAVHRRAPRRP